MAHKHGMFPPIVGTGVVWPQNFTSTQCTCIFATLKTNCVNRKTVDNEGRKEYR